MAALTATPAPSSAAPAQSPTPGLSTDTGANEGLLAALAARTGVDVASRSAGRAALGVSLPTLAPTAVAPAVAPTPPPAPPAAPAVVAAPAPTPAVTPVSRSADTSAYAAAGAARGLGPNARAVYSAIRAQFGITNIGGYRAGGGDHGAGKACDVMITDRATGDAVAAYAIAHARELNIKYVIWRQRIYLIDQPGWRMMADRGGITANHYDHVHISVS